MKILLNLLILLFLTAFPLTAQVNVGEEAPNFSLSYLGGGAEDRIELSELNGKVVYIFFYGAGCPHCRSNGPITETEIHQSFAEDTNFVALGLDTWNQSQSSNAGFKSVTGITYDLLLNARDILVAYYGNASAYDRSVVVGADGLIKYKGNTWVSTGYQDVVATIETELSALTTSSEDEEELPFSLQLDQNYPNPFNPSTTISYTLNTTGEVKLQIFNLLGKEVATLINEVQPSGSQLVTWNASEIPSGIYIYRLTVGDEMLTKRMTLIK